MIGAKIVNIRNMTDEEYQNEGWHKSPYKYTQVLEFDNGCIIYPSKDSEGNDSGVLFGHDKKNKEFFTVGNQAVDTSHLSNDEFGEYIRNCHK